MPPITSKEIVIRLSEAWNQSSQKWGAKSRFFEKYKIDRGNFYRTLKHAGDHSIDVAWIAAIVIEFDVSADWILTGREKEHEINNHPI